MAPLGIEPMTFRLVAQFLNQLRNLLLQSALQPLVGFGLLNCATACPNYTAVAVHIITEFIFSDTNGLMMVVLYSRNM
jgi:hypothetical protein